MPKTMKAAVVREFCKPLVIEEVAVPEPGAGQIQVKIEASGVCHTDLHAAEGDWPVKPKPPFILGQTAHSNVYRSMPERAGSVLASIIWALHFGQAGRSIGTDGMTDDRR